MSRVIDYILANHWALSRSVVDNGIALVTRHAKGERASAEDVAQIMAARDSAREEAYASRPWDGVLGQAAQEDRNQGYSIVRDTAIVPVEGVLSRWASYINGASQPRGTSSQAVVNSLKAAAADPRAKAIVMEIDSPGGTVGGTEEMADAVRAAAALKPVVAWAAYLCCSGAYWVASQANSIVATKTALVGNIGTYQILYDTSAQAAMDGVKVLVVKRGEFKAIGVDGAPITDAQQKVVQQEIDATYAVFVKEAAAGRRMSETKMLALADGRAHTGQDAKDLKLADAVGGLDEAITLALSGLNH